MKISGVQIFFIVLAILLAVGGVAILLTGKGNPRVGPEKKTDNFVDSSPAHGDVLNNAPSEIMINFNSLLGPGSGISVKSSGKEYGSGGGGGGGGSSLSATIDPNAPNGVYDVYYRACDLDGSCDDGFFSFVIDRPTFENVRGKTEVVIDAESLREVV
ncbi:MAG: copper resistance protein CopC [Candidatus Nanoarchaeia archaeon]